MTCLILGDNPFEILFFGLKQPRVKSPQDRFSPTGLGRLIDRGGQFTKSRSSETAEATWRADNNHVEQFLSECVYQNAYARIAVQTLYNPYTGWTCHGLVPLHVLMLSGYSFKSQGTFPT
jgi:hypothetical protein